jgi:YHS domain-containing protein
VRHLGSDPEVERMSKTLRRLPCDPVCGREMTDEQALLTAEVKGETYVFCSERCRMLFAIRPGWFLERTEPRPSRKVS